MEVFLPPSYKEWITELLSPLQEMLSRLHFRPLALLASLLSLTPHVQSADNCPDYADFSQSPQGNASLGPLKLPYMRPAPECRTFTSPAVEVP